jgi:nucleoside 2-deoxyribosyltransferase
MLHNEDWRAILSNKTIYLAGPEVFLPYAIEIGIAKKRLCAEFGFEGLFPFDNELPQDVAAADRSRLIFEANEAMMRQADLIIANLTPFRGPSADAGTVYEVGFMAGLGKPRLGYSNCVGDLLRRTLDADRGAHRREADGAWVDSRQMAIEDFGNADNLMITETLAAAGLKLVVNDVPDGERFGNLEGFRMCLKLAQELP